MLSLTLLLIASKVFATSETKKVEATFPNLDVLNTEISELSEGVVSKKPDVVAAVEATLEKAEEAAVEKAKETVEAELVEEKAVEDKQE